MALNGRPPLTLAPPRLRRLPRLEVAPMIDADNERASDGRQGRQWATTAAGDQIGDDYVLSSVPSSHFHPLNPSLSLIHFRRDIRSRRGPLLGGRGGGAWHHGVHHVQIGADNQLHQIPDRALRGLLRGVRGNWEVRTEDKCLKLFLIEAVSAVNVLPSFPPMFEQSLLLSSIH